MAQTLTDHWQIDKIFGNWNTKVGNDPITTIRSLGADASFSPLPGRMISNSFHLLASFNFRWHFVSSSAAPSQTPLIKIFKIAHININFNTLPT